MIPINQLLASEEGWPALEKIWRLEQGHKNIREYNKQENWKKERTQLGVSFENVPKIMVAIPKKTHIWDLKTGHFLSLPQDITIQIYNRPDPKLFFIIVGHDPESMMRYKVHQDDLRPLHPIEDLRMSPPYHETYPKKSFITQDVKAKWSFQGVVSYGQQIFKADSILGKDPLNPQFLSGELRGLFRGSIPLQVGLNVLYRRSILTDSKKQYGQNAYYLGPLVRYPVWGHINEMFTKIGILKSLHNYIYRRGHGYYFSNYLLQMGIDYQIPSPPYYDTVISITIFQEWYNLRDQYQGRPNDYGLTSQGILLSFGFNWNIL